MTRRDKPQFGSHMTDAIYAHDCDRVRELLADGDDPNRVDRWGMSLLIKASMGGDVDIVEARNMMEVTSYQKERYRAIIELMENG